MSKNCLTILRQIREASNAKELLAIRSGLESFPTPREREQAQYAINKRFQSFTVTHPHPHHD